MLISAPVLQLVAYTEIPVFFLENKNTSDKFASDTDYQI